MNPLLPNNLEFMSHTFVSNSLACRLVRFPPALVASAAHNGQILHRYDVYGTAVGGPRPSASRRRIGGNVKCVLLSSTMFAIFLVCALWLRSSVTGTYSLPNREPRVQWSYSPLCREGFGAVHGSELQVLRLGLNPAIPSPRAATLQSPFQATGHLQTTGLFALTTHCRR